MCRWSILCVGVLFCPMMARADDAEAVARGKKALESRAFTPTRWTFEAYENAWQHWTPKLAKAPDNYDRAFRAYYGLHAAPFENGRYPLGLRKGPDGKGLVIDCMMCHGGSIFGKSYVGLGNSTIDLQAFYEDMSRASGKADKLPFAAGNVRGTNEAFALAEFLLSLRDANLGVRKMPQPWKIHGELCEDVPAWWHLQKKKTMYRTGSTNARSVRALMQFMLNPGNPLATFEKEEPVFRDIQAYLLSLEAPKYPFPVQEKIAGRGRELFSDHCAKCHGTYGANAKYPNKIVPHKVIRTDEARMHGLSRDFIKFYNNSWFAKETPKGCEFREATGYQAPPLDGVWATAPYLHNGSAPTLYDVLNSKTRPTIFTRSFATTEDAYDKVNVGWKVEVLRVAPKDLPAHEQRKIYDTTQPGRGNGGHTFGDDFTDEERRAVIEYLKTL